MTQIMAKHRPRCIRHSTRSFGRIKNFVIGTKVDRSVRVQRGRRFNTATRRQFPKFAPIGSQRVEVVVQRAEIDRPISADCGRRENHTPSEKLPACGAVRIERIEFFVVRSEINRSIISNPWCATFSIHAGNGGWNSRRSRSTLLPFHLESDGRGKFSDRHGRQSDHFPRCATS